MKKLLLLGLFFLTACQPPSNSQTATPKPTSTPAVTTTRFIPTPVPATATETLTPPPTFTPEPPPRFFTEEFDSTPVYWSTLYASGDPGRVEILNNDSALTFEIYSPNAWTYAIYGAQEYDTVHIETSVKSTGNDNNYVGLICSYDEQEGWFEFNISSDGTYSLLYGQWLADGIANYMPIADGPSEYINVGNTANELGLECLNGVLQLFINGQLFRKIDVSRFELSGGKVGLAVASFDKLPVILAFDWVKVGQSGGNGEN
jgi:hypothetical protein